MGIAGGVGGLRPGPLALLDGGLGSRNWPSFCLIPGWMAQSAVVRDCQQMEVGRRRANRLVKTVSG